MIKSESKNIPKIENIRVCIRMRPLLRHEDKAYWEVDQEENNIYTVNYFTSQEINDSLNVSFEGGENNFKKSYFNSLHAPQKFTFDRIYSYNSESQMIYKDICQDIVKSLIEGYNGSIFTYGQTTSGKTFTMLGSPNIPGILPCALNDTFIYVNKLEQSNKNILVNIYCSYIEIYNEKINDLLDNSNNLKLIDDKKYGTIVCGAKRVKIKSFEQGIAIKDYGEENRKYRETLINEYSSRSHCIFQIYLEQFRLNNEGEINKSYFSCLNLVDLAGSERINEKEHKKMQKEHIGETGYINKSLFMLTNVINKLAENSSSLNKKIYIPYRDSKLTRLLSQSLGGNSLTTIICTISPASMNYYQTLSTLRFAMRAKCVTLRATTNEYFDDKDKIYYYQKEIKKLKDQLRNRDNKRSYNNLNNMNFTEESIGQVSQYEYNKIVNAYQNLNEELENYKQLYLKEKRKSARYKAQIDNNYNFKIQEEIENEDEEDDEEEDDNEKKEIIDSNNVSTMSANFYPNNNNNDFKSYKNFKLSKRNNQKIININNGGINPKINNVNNNINNINYKVNYTIATNNKDKDEYEQLKKYIRINRNKSYKNNLQIKRLGSYDSFKKVKKKNKPIKTEMDEKSIRNKYSQMTKLKNNKNNNTNKNIIKYNSSNNYSKTEYDETYETSEKNYNKIQNKKYGYITSRKKNEYDEKSEKGSNGKEEIQDFIYYDKNEETINAIKNGDVFNMLDVNYNEIVYNNKKPNQIEILKKLYAFKMDALEKTLDYYQSYVNDYFKNKINEINNIKGYSENIQNKKRKILNNTTEEFKNILNRLEELYKEKKEELEYKFAMFLKNISA